MANDRMRLRCTVCNGSFAIAKCMADYEWYSTPGVDSITPFNKFLNDHIHWEDQANGKHFDLVYENDTV